jgi:GcrA cell cycle regulator
MSEGWTEERVARLKAMVEEGASAATIAEALGDVSRPAVIGKCHRLGLELKLPPGGEGQRLAREANAGAAIAPRRTKAQASAPKSPAPKAAKSAPSPPPIVVEPEVDPTPRLWPKPAGPEAVTLDQLRTGHCRMPLWGLSDRSGLFCGKPVRGEGQSWCAACTKLVFERRPIRERELREMQQARMARQGRTGAFA